MIDSWPRSNEPDIQDGANATLRALINNLTRLRSALSAAGAAYLQIMRGLHAARGQKKSYRPVLHVDSAPYPVQIVWGAKDPILTMRRFGWRALDE